MTPGLAMVVLSTMTFVLAAVTFSVVELVAGNRDSGKCPPDCPACPERRAE